VFQSRPSSRIKWFGLLVGGLLVFATIDSLSQPDGQRATPASLVMDMGTWSQQGLLDIAAEVSDGLVTYRSLLQAQEEIGQLRRDARRVRALEVELKQLQTENQMLRRWSLFPQSPEHFRPIGANVVGKHKTATGKVLRIDQGKNAGIKKGDGVVNVDHEVVGRVLWVSEHAADVVLATHPASAIDVLVQRSRAHGLARGSGKRHDGNMVVEDFDRLMDVQENDLIVTAGANGDFPKGLPVARVKEVFPPHEGVYLRANLEWVVASEDAEMLWVLRTHKETPYPRLGDALAEIFEPLPAPQPKLEALVASSDPAKKSEPQRMQVMAAPSKPEPSEVKKAPAKEASDKPRVLEIEELKKLMAVIAPSGVKIRSGPGQEHWVVGTKFKGATLAATGKVKGKDWIRVSLPTGIQGYVFAPLLADVGANATQGTQP
tara:strand:+ start:164 stop:1459 length:1296 start_codon:yes stop_codon:yes gene_type:complete